jgi:hypothetical protein
MGDEQIAGGLCGPCSGWVGDDSGEDQLAGVHLMKNTT